MYNACGGDVGLGLGCLLQERLSVDYEKKSRLRFTVWVTEEIDHVLEACGRGRVSVKTHEICIHNIPVSCLFLSQCLLPCCLQP